MCHWRRDFERKKRVFNRPSRDIGGILFQDYKEKKYGTCSETHKGRRARPGLDADREKRKEDGVGEKFTETQ